MLIPYPCVCANQHVLFVSICEKERESTVSTVCVHGLQLLKTVKAVEMG